MVVIDVPTTGELLPWNGSRLTGDEMMRLIAHSCYCLEVDEKKVLFDPWIFGDSYWGSWSLWPTYEIPEKDLEGITDIVITHPHPDHFHIPTLERFDRNVCVHFPPFLSQIIPVELEKLGFKNLTEHWWEKRFNIGPSAQLSFLRPTSFWEDAAVLVRVKDWVWLNQNDAGAPLTHSKIPRVDLLSTGFDAAASGYPLTWEISDGKKKSMMKGKKAKILATIRERCADVEARFFSPFASWWRHSHPDQIEFEELIQHVDMADLRLTFSSSETQLLETYPGSVIRLKDMSLMSNFDNLDFSMPMKNKKNSDKISKNRFKIRDELGKALHALADMSKAVDCESVRFIVNIETVSDALDIYFGPSESVSIIEIEVTIPLFIAQLLVSNDKSVTWDSIAIGYWGRWKRKPDVYPGKFMRLLQLGYVSELACHSDSGSKHESDVLEKSIASLLEINFEVASRILNRYGMPCAACDRASSETLRDAIHIHSISDNQVSAMANEMNALLHSHEYFDVKA
jgi:hypothetical protein